MVLQIAQKVLLDTDIGDDIDDAMALALICGCPELELLGVTTVYGNVVARTRQARTIVKLAGPRFADTPVAAGCGSSDAPLPNQDCTCLPDCELPPLDPRHGVDLIIDTIRAGCGDIIPITIGAMTNLAAAITRKPQIASVMPKIIVMAGEFIRDMVEWNVRCDPQAAHTVFSSGIPVDVITWDIGNTVRFTPQDLDRLAASDHPVARNLLLAMRA